jgi:hypothetical protein
VGADKAGHTDVIIESAKRTKADMDHTLTISDFMSTRPCRKAENVKASTIENLAWAARRSMGAIKQIRNPSDLRAIANVDSRSNCQELIQRTHFRIPQ